MALTLKVAYNSKKFADFGARNILDASQAIYAIGHEIRSGILDGSDKTISQLSESPEDILGGFQSEYLNKLIDSVEEYNARMRALAEILRENSTLELTDRLYWSFYNQSDRTSDELKRLTDAVSNIGTDSEVFDGREVLLSIGYFVPEHLQDFTDENGVSYETGEEVALDIVNELAYEPLVELWAKHEDQVTSRVYEVFKRNFKSTFGKKR